jgi:hypothetical protein
LNGPLKLLSSHLRPMLVDSWMKKRNTMLSGNAERRRRLLDNLQKQIDEVTSLDIPFTHSFPFLASLVFFSFQGSCLVQILFYICIALCFYDISTLL